MKQFKGFNVKFLKIDVYSAKILYAEYKEKNFLDLLNYLKRIYGFESENPEIYYDCYGLMYEHVGKKGRIFYMFINLDKDSSEYVNTFCHELVHIIDGIKRHYGLTTHVNDDNEHISYLQGYIAEQLLNKKLIK